MSSQLEGLRVAALLERRVSEVEFRYGRLRMREAGAEVVVVGNQQLDYIGENHGRQRATDSQARCTVLVSLSLLDRWCDLEYNAEHGRWSVAGPGAAVYLASRQALALRAKQQQRKERCIVMKGRILATLLVLIVLAGLLVLYPTAQGPVEQPAGGVPGSPSAPSNIGSSTVDGPYTDGILIDVFSSICFHVTVNSTDAEFMDRFDVDLPDSWVIGTVDHVAPSSNCLVDTIEGVEAGNVVYWQVDATMPSNCGPWWDGGYDFCFDAYTPDCADEPWNLFWSIAGDGFGDPPHSVVGFVGPVHCRAPGLYLRPEELFVEGCHGEESLHLMNLFNYTFTDGNWHLSYQVMSGNAAAKGPDEVYLGHEADQDLLIAVEPHACLPHGDEVIIEVTAADWFNEDMSTVHLTVLRDNGCTECKSVFLPITLRNY